MGMCDYYVVKQSFSPNRQASLGKNEMVTMLDLNPLLTVFPLLLSFNFCVSTPLITPQVPAQIRSKFWVSTFLQIGGEVAEDNAVVDNIENEWCGGDGWGEPSRQFPMPGTFALLLCFHLHRGYARSTYEQDLHHLFPTKMRQKTFPVTIWGMWSLSQRCGFCELFPDFLNKWPTAVGEGMLRCYI